MTDTPLTKKISLTDLAKEFIAHSLKPGDIAIDATVGNGHDTLFLSTSVGSTGKVYGFDIQAQALDTARAYLTKNQRADNVSLLKDCHSNIALLPDDTHGKITAAMFNLGYLPGSDKKIITHSNTTTAALTALLPLLADSARISILAYRGHAGGEQEAEAIMDYCSKLDKKIYTVNTHSVTATKSIPPILIAVTKNLT